MVQHYTVWETMNKWKSHFLKISFKCVWHRALLLQMYMHYSQHRGGGVTANPLGKKLKKQNRGHKRRPFQGFTFVPTVFTMCNFPFSWTWQLYKAVSFLRQFNEIKNLVISDLFISKIKWIFTWKKLLFILVIV